MAKVLRRNNRHHLACIEPFACYLLDCPPMPLKRAGDVVGVGPVGDSAIAQGGPFHPATDTVVAVEHHKQNSFGLRLLEVAGRIRTKGHLATQ